jgi:hypothetical protein
VCSRVCTMSQYRTKLLLLSHNFSNVMINNTSTDEAHYGHQCCGEVCCSMVAYCAHCFDEPVVRTYSLEMYLEDCPRLVGGRFGSPFTHCDVKATHCCYDVVGDANDGWSHGCVSSHRCESHSIVDLREDDLDGWGGVHWLFI